MLEVDDRVDCTYGICKIFEIDANCTQGLVYKVITDRGEVIWLGESSVTLYPPEGLVILRLGYIIGDDRFIEFDTKRPNIVELHEPWLAYIKEKYGDTL